MVLGQFVNPPGVPEVGKPWIRTIRGLPGGHVMDLHTPGTHESTLTNLVRGDHSGKEKNGRRRKEESSSPRGGSGCAGRAEFADV